MLELCVLCVQPDDLLLGYGRAMCAVCTSDYLLLGYAKTVCCVYNQTTSY